MDTPSDYARAYAELSVAMDMLNQRTNELVASRAQNMGLRNQIVTQEEELKALRAQVAESQSEPEVPQADEPGVLVLETG